MDILIVPITVGIGVYLLEQWQRRREQEERERQERRREEEREKAAALEKYFEQMSEALTAYELSNAKPENEVAKFARARTLSILGILDPVRKGQVVSFPVRGLLIASLLLSSLKELTSLGLSSEINLSARSTWLTPNCAKRL
jgi:hypothetical protein